MSHVSHVAEVEKKEGKMQSIIHRRRSFYKHVSRDQMMDGEIKRSPRLHRKSFAGISLEERPLVKEYSTQKIKDMIPTKGPRKSKLWQLQDEEEDDEDSVFTSPSDEAAPEVTQAKLLEITDTDIQELFALMDVNKDQLLAPKELDCILRALGINATEADLIEFIGELDRGPDKDCVTYEQFAESIKKNSSSTNETDSLQDTFNAFDHAGDGFIDSEKMSHVLSNLGLQFQLSEVQEIIQEIGTDGRIMFDDFQKFMLNTEIEE